MSKEKDKRNKEIEKLHFEGYSLSELAERFDITKQRVEQILKYQRQLKILFRRFKKKGFKI